VLSNIHISVILNILVFPRLNHSVQF